MNLKNQNLEEIFSIYSKNFNQGFIEILKEIDLNENPLNSSKILKEPNGNPTNIFGKLKNPLLRNRLNIGKKVKYDNKKHITIRELGFKSIYEMDKRSKKFWENYFSKFSVFLNEDLNDSVLSKRILFDKNILKFLKKSPRWTFNWGDREKFKKPKRKFVKGGKFGKLKGFNFYLNHREKLQPSQRKKFLERSESIVSKLNYDLSPKFHSLDKIGYPDSTYDDIELVNYWNSIYDSFGYLMDEFKEKWNREFIKINDIGDKYQNENSSPPKSPQFLKYKVPTRVENF